MNEWKCWSWLQSGCGFSSESPVGFESALSVKHTQCSSHAVKDHTVIGKSIWPYCRSPGVPDDWIPQKHSVAETQSKWTSQMCLRSEKYHQNKNTVNTEMNLCQTITCSSGWCVCVCVRVLIWVNVWWKWESQVFAVTSAAFHTNTRPSKRPDTFSSHTQTLMSNAAATHKSTCAFK